MKKGGIYHPAINHLLASTGHTDYFTVCDRGFPVPVGPERIDLALTDDIPTVLDVIRAVMPEFQIDRVLIATEACAASPNRVTELRELLGPDPAGDDRSPRIEGAGEGRTGDDPDGGYHAIRKHNHCFRVEPVTMAGGR